VFRHVIEEEDSEFFKGGLTFLKPERLISRDDIQKYESEEERQAKFFERELALTELQKRVSGS